MSSLSVVESKLPPGFRFHPRDDELICDYLMRWVMGCPAHPLLPFLIQVDLNKCEPWDIPETACVNGKEWYFYTQRDRKYATGLRTNRATMSGYWKATGKDRPVIRKGNIVGMRKTLVFYQGRAPKGRKTDWVLHEYRLEGATEPGPNTVSPVKEDWVLCRVFYKNTSESQGKCQNVYGITPSSPCLPTLMEPYNSYNSNSITFNQNEAGSSDVYNEQVPCFSISSKNQTSLTFCGVNDDPSFSYSSCDEKLIKTGSCQFTKMECTMDSPSFGEGSSDSYLSEVGLCTLWSRYS